MSYNLPGMVSVLVPNYNNAQFIGERFDTILSQTYKNFEVIVCDSFSTDGAWAIIQSYAERDERIKAVQVPKEGIYAGWNACLSRAIGEFVYIATSDDTMAPTCLGDLVTALNDHPECSLSMCGLDLIDERGVSLPSDLNWESYPFGQYFRDLIETSHKRLAPLDGILAGVLHCVWHSTTQLMARRRVYERNGLYRTNLGSIADFEWNARVAFNEDVIYLPGRLATLRVHRKSASAERGGYSVADIQQKRAILNLLLFELKSKHPDLVKKLVASGWTDAFLFQEAIYAVRELRLGALSELVKLWKSSSRDWNLLAKVSMGALFGKENVRRIFVDSLLRKIGMDLANYIEYGRK
jgi:glycosyltransferase involved in cell wall biosynthesis